MATARTPRKPPASRSRPGRAERRERRRELSGKGFHRGDGIPVPKGYGSLAQQKSGRLNEVEEGKLRKALGARSKSEDGHAVHLRVRFVRCGKARCRGDVLHGPYVYEVWRGDDGQRHERYLGKPDLE